MRPLVRLARAALDTVLTVAALLRADPRLIALLLRRPDVEP